MTESAGEVHRVHLIRVVTLVAEQLPAVDYRLTFDEAFSTSWLQAGAAQRSSQSPLPDHACKLAAKTAGTIDDQRQRHTGDSQALLKARLQLIGDFAQRCLCCFRCCYHLLASDALGRCEHHEPRAKIKPIDAHRRVTGQLASRQVPENGGDSDDR